MKYLILALSLAAAASCVDNKHEAVADYYCHCLSLAAPAEGDMDIGTYNSCVAQLDTIYDRVGIDYDAMSKLEKQRYQDRVIEAIRVSDCGDEWFETMGY